MQDMVPDEDTDTRGTRLTAVWIDLLNAELMSV